MPPNKIVFFFSQSTNISPPSGLLLAPCSQSGKRFQCSILHPILPRHGSVAIALTAFAKNSFNFFLYIIKHLTSIYPKVNIVYSQPFLYSSFLSIYVSSQTLPLPLYRVRLFPPTLFFQVGCNQKINVAFIKL